MQTYHIWYTSPGYEITGVIVCTRSCANSKWEQKPAQWSYSSTDLGPESYKETHLTIAGTSIINILKNRSGYKTISIFLNRVRTVKRPITIVHINLSNRSLSYCVLEISLCMTSSGCEIQSYVFGVKVYASIGQRLKVTVCMFKYLSFADDGRLELTTFHHKCGLEYSSISGNKYYMPPTTYCKHVLIRNTLLVYQCLPALITVFDIPIYG